MDRFERERRGTQCPYEMIEEDFKELVVLLAVCYVLNATCF